MGRDVFVMEADANQKLLCLKSLSHFGNRAWLTRRESPLYYPLISSLTAAHPFFRVIFEMNQTQFRGIVMGESEPR